MEKLKALRFAIGLYGMYRLSFAHIPSQRELNSKNISPKKRRRLEYHKAVHEGLRAEQNLLSAQIDRLTEIQEDSPEYIRQAIWIWTTIRSIVNNKKELMKQHQGIFPLDMRGN